MRIEPVRIYSDASHGAVIRHRGRRFPGALIQGDTLSRNEGFLHVDCRVRRDAVTCLLPELIAREIHDTPRRTGN